MKTGYYLLILTIGISFPLIAQGEDKACLEAVIAYENKLLAQDWNENGKPTFISYKVRSEDWENNIIESEVKMYRNKTNLHFFSDQVNIYTDQNETFMVLKAQKMVMASTTPKTIVNTGMSDEFLIFRTKFLRTCEIESYSMIDSVKGIQQVKLKLGKEMEGMLDIKSMTYKFDSKNKKVISTAIVYESSYKLKKMTITYRDFKPTVEYSFLKARKYVLNGNGSLLEKYKGYEFFDDRVKVKSPSKTVKK